MAALCRKLEKEYHLRQVLNPKAFLSPRQRQLPRHDQRKEKLKTDIRKTLEQVRDYPAFEQTMKALGYQVLKGRGIAFIDNKKVKTKGSEVGFSLMTIEKILRLKNEIAEKKSAYEGIETPAKIRRIFTPTQRLLRETKQEVTKELPAIETLEKALNILLNAGTRTEEIYDYPDPSLVKKRKRKRKKKGLHHQ